MSERSAVVGKGRWRPNSEALTGYLFIAPQLLLFLVFIIYPIFEGFRISLFKVTFKKDIFVGLANYATLFKDEIFLRSIGNTIIFVVAIVTLTIVVAIFIASAVFDKRQGYVSFIRGAFYMPVMVSMVVMSMVWNFLLNPANGLINYLLGMGGIKGINPLGDPKLVMPIIIFVTFISNLGQAVILYIAAMIGVPKDLFEAAEVDGARRIERIRHILIPLVQPTTLYLIVINIIGVLKIFVVIQLLTDGGPMNKSVTMMYYLYQSAFVYNNVGQASAIGVMMFVLAVLFALPQFKAFKENL